MPQGVALEYLFFAYTAVFIILIAFLARSFRHLRQMEQEIKRLEEDNQDSA